MTHPMRKEDFHDSSKVFPPFPEDTASDIHEAITDLSETPISQININTCTQAELELMYSKHQLKPTIRNEFIEGGFEAALIRDGIDEVFGLAVLTEMALRKRCNVNVILGITRTKAPDEDLQGAADLIFKMCDLDYMDSQQIIKEENDGHSQELIVKYQVSPAVQAKIDVFQFPLPMVVKPEHVTGNQQTGYQTIKGSLILRNNHHDDDICLDHINRANKIPLSLDADVVSFIQNQWKNLDKPKEGETRQEYQKRVRAFQKYDRSSRDVLEALMAQGNRFYLTHKYDKRGRSYSVGYHANYQGNDWNKSCIQFAEGEIINTE